MTYKTMVVAMVVVMFLAALLRTAEFFHGTTDFQSLLSAWSASWFCGLFGAVVWDGL